MHISMYIILSNKLVLYIFNLAIKEYLLFYTFNIRTAWFIKLFTNNLKPRTIKSKKKSYDTWKLIDNDKSPGISQNFHIKTRSGTCLALRFPFRIRLQFFQRVSEVFSVGELIEQDRDILFLFVLVDIVTYSLEELFDLDLDPRTANC